jgi:uncharacterized protein YbjQ (UPF0145 family)
MSIQACTICKKNFDSFNRRPNEIFCNDCYEEGCAQLKKKEFLKNEEKIESQQQQSVIDSAINALKLTTTPDYPYMKVEEVMGIVTSECVFGMNIFRDFFAGMSDFFGGRSKASQKVLREARETCLAELKKEAYEIGADGVIGIDLDYSEISDKGKGMLFLVASGTAVKLKPS